MKPSFAIIVAVCAAVAPFFALSVPAAEAPTPAPGWKLELLAQAPDVMHPGTVVCSPDGRIFVAEDPMDIRTERADLAEGRILCFHPDGRRTVFVDKVYAAFGMQYLDGRLYVLHNPFFSAWSDAGDYGTNRVDLVTNTNPNWHALGWNDHVPANFRLGLDGRFYVATGDKGLFGAIGRDNNRFDFFGGGIFRMRPSGTELEPFSTGVRNIMDVALDAEDNAFTYDNTDEHEWMGRLTYMVNGGFYGYPHDFIPRRPYTLWCFGDFGAGAATAVVCALNDALPPNQRGDLFLADFGKRNVLRVKVTPSNGGFAVVGPAGPVRGVAGIADVQPMFTDPPEDFRPVGLTFTPDGRSLLIGDWQHRDSKDTNAHVGRLWKLRWTGSENGVPFPPWYVSASTGKPFEASDELLLAGLSHPSKEVRHCAQRRLVERAVAGSSSKMVQLLQTLAANPTAEPYPRIHALWALDAILRQTQPDRIDEGPAANTLANLVMSPDLIVARQAMRRAGEARDTRAASKLVARLRDQDPSLRFAASTALGQVAAPEAVGPLLEALGDEASWPRYAAFTALNRIGRAHSNAWPAIVRRLTDPDPRIAQGASFALRATYDLALVRALLSFQEDSAQPAPARVVATDLLAAVCRQPPAWQGDWWAYHPFRTPAPASSVEWA
ncbi:MAG TPA: hypothetical protein DCE44_16350, partial [Verrucomicrobiales bacterium]|nr:hypothetical protein [Verrucomicrobiales bacterium]